MSVNVLSLQSFVRARSYGRVDMIEMVARLFLIFKLMEKNSLINLEPDKSLMISGEIVFRSNQKN